MDHDVKHKTIYAIRDNHNLSANCKLVLIMLATRGDDSWPSQQTLADDTGLSVPTVNKTLKTLRDVGIIQVKRTGRSNRYSIKIGDLITPEFRSDPSEVEGKEERENKKERSTISPREMQQAVIGRFVEHYKQVSGTDPIIGAKEFAAAKRLYSQLPLDEALDVIDAAFEDPWFRDKCRDLAFIASKINTYRRPTRPQHKVYDPKEDKPVENAVPMPGSILDALNEQIDKGSN